MQPRIGFGTDLHRLEIGDGLRLGGIVIPCALRAVAHSDGDALYHAATDAILGALGQPDIGQIFPDTEAQNRSRDSADFLGEAIRRMRAASYQFGNLDAVVTLEQPRLAPHKERMRANLARLCACAPDAVNIKAKTAEGLGPIGESRAVRVDVVVLLVPATEG